MKRGAQWAYGLSAYGLLFVNQNQITKHVEYKVFQYNIINTYITFTNKKNNTTMVDDSLMLSIFVLGRSKVRKDFWKRPKENFKT